MIGPDEAPDVDPQAGGLGLGLKEASMLLTPGLMTGLAASIESIAKDRAMGVIGLTGLSLGSPCKGIEKMGSRMSLRRAKKRLTNLARRGCCFRRNDMLFMISDDPRDYGAARSFLKGYNRARRRAWEGLSEEEQREAMNKARWTLVGSMSLMPIASLAYLNSSGFKSKLEASSLPIGDSP